MKAPSCLWKWFIEFKKTKYCVYELFLKIDVLFSAETRGGLRSVQRQNDTFMGFVDSHKNMKQQQHYALNVSHHLKHMSSPDAITKCWYLTANHWFIKMSLCHMTSMSGGGKSGCSRRRLNICKPESTGCYLKGSRDSFRLFEVMKQINLNLDQVFFVPDLNHDIKQEWTWTNMKKCEVPT